MRNEEEDRRAWNSRRQLQMYHNSYTTRQNCALADWERHEGWRIISQSLISSWNLLHFRFLHQRKWWLWLVFVAPSLAVYPQGLFPLFSESILTIFVLLVQLQSTSLNHEVCVVKQHKKEWKISFKLCKKSHYYSKKIKKNRERERSHVLMNEVLMKSTARFHYGFSVAVFKGRPLWFLYRDQRRMTQKSLAHFAVVGSKFALSPSSWNNTS